MEQFVLSTCMLFAASTHGRCSNAWGACMLIERRAPGLEECHDLSIDPTINRNHRLCPCVCAVETAPSSLLQTLSEVGA